MHGCVSMHYSFLDVHGCVHHIHGCVLLSTNLGMGVHGLVHGHMHGPCISLDSQLGNTRRVHRWIHGHVPCLCIYLNVVASPILLPISFLSL